MYIQRGKIVHGRDGHCVSWYAESNVLLWIGYIDISTSSFFVVAIEKGQEKNDVNEPSLFPAAKIQELSNELFSRIRRMISSTKNTKNRKNRMLQISIFARSLRVLRSSVYFEYYNIHDEFKRSFQASLEEFTRDKKRCTTENNIAMNTRAGTIIRNCDLWQP